MKQSWKNRLASLHAQRTSIAERIESLRCERKARSAALQAKLFRKFRLLNALGEIRDLAEIFAPTPQGTPRPVQGVCGPKLLQYAFEHRLTPLAIAEFWWGASPKGEIRRHGHYYPACRGKCGPILAHMLRGLDVEPEPDRACPQSAPEAPVRRPLDSRRLQTCRDALRPRKIRLRRSSTGLGSVIPQLRDRSSSTASIWTPRVYCCSP